MSKNLLNINVFLCYHDVDSKIVQKLSDGLIVAGGMPWSASSIHAGQDRNLEIYKAMRNSDAVIVCVSAKALAAEGDIHKEIKHAMDIQDEKPRGTIFLIPLRLELCEIPIHLQHLEWADYFSPNGYTKLIKALEVRATQLNKYGEKRIQTLSVNIATGKLDIQETLDNPQQPNSLIAVNEYIDKFKVLTKLSEEGVIKGDLVEEYQRKLLDQILLNQIKFIER